MYLYRDKIAISCCIILALHNIVQNFISSDTKKELVPHTINETSHECEYMPWQKAGFLTGNLIHEIDLIGSLIVNKHTKIAGVGGTRMAWILSDFSNKAEIIYKTISWKRKVNELTIQGNHNDAIATEKLSFSSHVVDMYGYSGTSIFVEKGLDGADNIFLKEKSSSNTLKILYFVKNAARSIADVHSIVHENSNITALIHADVRPWNFLIMDYNGRKEIKLHDFNLAKLRGFYNDTGEICLKQHLQCNRNKSPEECERGGIITEKIDVYGLGNFIYFLLVHKGLYNFVLTNKWIRKQLVKHGIKPALPAHIRHSNDPSIISMRTMMNKCTSFHPKDRPSAKKVADELDEAYQRIVKLAF